MGIDRSDFLKVATAGAGLAITGSPAEAEATRPGSQRSAFVRSGQAPDVIVVGAENLGCCTELHLQRMGAKVTLLDQYGPGNSRSASGGETRGVRSSYGDVPHGLFWGGWAESFKQGPVLGEYIAGRIMGTENDQELNDSFSLLEEEFSEDQGRRGRGGGRGNDF